MAARRGCCAARRRGPRLHDALQGALLPAHLRQAAADARPALRVVGELRCHLRLPPHAAAAGLGRRRVARPSKPVVVGHCGRVHLPIPGLLPLALAAQDEDGGRARPAAREHAALLARRCAPHPPKSARRAAPCAAPIPTAALRPLHTPVRLVGALHAVARLRAARSPLTHLFLSTLRPPPARLSRAPGCSPPSWRRAPAPWPRPRRRQRWQRAACRPRARRTARTRRPICTACSATLPSSAR